MFGQQSDTDSFFFGWRLKTPSFEGPAQSYSMTTDCIYVNRYCVMKGVHSENKASIHAFHNRETFLKRVRNFKQVFVVPINLSLWSDAV